LGKLLTDGVHTIPDRRLGKEARLVLRCGPAAASQPRTAVKARQGADRDPPFRYDKSNATSPFGLSAGLHTSSDPNMNAQWRVRPFDQDKICALSRESGLHPLVAQVLWNRGITDPVRARAYLDAKRGDLHDPETLPGACEAADRLARAIRAGRKIVVYGDYDVDGVCGTSLLWSCLKLAGAPDAEYYIPHRVDEGYGLNGEALRRLAVEQKASLVITVDCGISAVAEAKLARELGVELIITDHHSIGPELPDAAALVHPALPGDYPFPHLCGAGVAFKVAWQLCKSFGDGKKASPHLRDFLMRAMNYVALATVADVVPLEGENRVFVRHGLRGILADESPGLKALLRVAGCLGRQKLNSGMVAFQLAPRINAAGRLEAAMRAVELLTTDDAELARSHAEYLDECNRRRQDIERAMVAEAHALIDAQGGLGQRGALVLGKPGWHAGVIGIVAGRLSDIYHRPTIIVALGDDVGQGSARSIPGFNLVEAIRECSEGLTGFGGHAAAAGLRLPVSAFASFAERFDAHCRSVLTAEHLRKELLIDAEVHIASLSTEVVESLDTLEPYGLGNPRPLLSAENLRVLGQPKIMGEKQNHLSVRFSQGESAVRAVGWNLAAKAKDLLPGTDCAAVFTVSINEYNGRRDVQLEIKDIQVRRESRHAQPA
jgi:single-stranded-DNA-specific exonuclease